MVALKIWKSILYHYSIISRFIYYTFEIGIPATNGASYASKTMIFDEFQSETNKYCADEIKKFLSIHTSVARGKGEQRRYVPVYMLSNQVSLILDYCPFLYLYLLFYYFY